MTIGLIAAGVGGGILRGMFGIAKDVALKKNVEINWPWLLISIAISAVIGVVAASFFNEDLRLALLAGYVGADFIEGLMKIKLNTMFNPKNGRGVDPRFREDDKTKKETGSFGDLLKEMLK